MSFLLDCLFVDAWRFVFDLVAVRAAGSTFPRLRVEVALIVFDASG
jgi:hypothetical protein